MINEENHTVELKSIEKVKGKPNLESMAHECVCFANAQGGVLFIELDNKTKEPPANQKIIQGSKMKLHSDCRMRI